MRIIVFILFAVLIGSSVSQTPDPKQNDHIKTYSDEIPPKENQNDKGVRKESIVTLNTDSKSESSASKSAASKLETKSSSSTPETKPSSSKPETKPSSSKPETKPSSSKPETKPSSSKPETKPTSSEPETKPSSSKPEAKSSSSKPEAKSSSSKPEAKPSPSKPETKPTSSKPTTSELKTTSTPTTNSIPKTAKPQTTKVTNDDITENADNIKEPLKTQKKVRNILAVFPYQGKSHHMFLHPVVKILLEDGHKVTSFMPLRLDENFKNHRHVLTKPTNISWQDIFEFEYQTSQTSWEARADLDLLAETFLFPLYESKEFADLLMGNEKFDMVLVEPFFMQEPLVFLGHRFNCPVVAIATGAPESIQDSYLGRPRNPAIESEWNTCALQPTLDFFQRTSNTFSWLLNALEHWFYYLPKREADMKRLLKVPGIDSLPRVSDMLRDISLTLANSHQLVNAVTPVAPNLILTPGLHIRHNETLTPELERLLDSAKNGFVLFTLGSMIPISKMKKERDVFIEALSKIPQLVIWKSDIDLPDVAKNIKTFKWLPQQAVLAHKNCKLFMTHGGMLGKQEAVYNGVPLVSIPLFGDQPMNTGHSQAIGLGITVQFKNITVDKLYNAITTVINDNQYSERLEKYSRIFREAVSHSKSSARYWLNHVMDHDGAAYLRQHHSLKWYQYYLLDVIAAFVGIAAFVIFILVKCAQGLYRLRFPTKQPQIKKVKKH